MNEWCDFGPLFFLHIPKTHTQSGHELVVENNVKTFAGLISFLYSSFISMLFAGVVCFQHHIPMAERGDNIKNTYLLCAKFMHASNLVVII